MKPAGSPTKFRKYKVLAFATAASLTLASCGGTDNSAAVNHERAGFDFGASQDEVNDAIEGLEPVTLVMQTGNSSAESISSRSVLKFVESVEDMSNGQIEIDLVWGSAIAPILEVDDALADGRLDIVQKGGTYEPDKYPLWNDLATFSQYAPPSPLVGTAVSSAMVADLAWNDDAVIEEMEAQGLVPLQPILSMGQWMTACSTPGSTLEDWAGTQIRIAASSQIGLSESIGASPVSMEFQEVYEALQRGTVDCAWAQASTTTDNGIAEVASYFSYPTQGGFAGQSTISILAGASFGELPLPYQQILFDAGVAYVDHFIQGVLLASVDVVETAKENGGGFEALDTETEEVLMATQEETAKAIEASGSLGDDIIKRAQDASMKWEEVASELGLEDGGDIDNIDEWYTDDVSFEDYVIRLYEDSYVEHRPK